MIVRRRAAAILLPAGLLCGCGTYQTALGGQAEQSGDFITLFTIFLVITGTIYLLVIAFLIVAIFRRRPDPHVADGGTHHESHPLLQPVLVAWTALIVVGLTGLTIASFFADRSMASAAARDQLQIEVTGNQWWWKVQYDHPDVSKTLVTANEIHLPVGVPARIILRSNDVIHSLWIPNLAGKQDLIPGRVTDLSVLPRKVGYYRAQCAEFCGAQHAHMALDVIVESRADFDRWWSAGLAPAQPPKTPLALAGYNYFTTRECSSCHTIAGTPAGGKVGPDLTHLASRRTIAAGTLPMNRGHLYGWIADPQSQKPGTKMPTVGIEPNDLHAVVAYLEGLK